MSPLRRKHATKNNNIEPSPANKKVFIPNLFSQINKNFFTSVKGMSRSASPPGSMTVEAALLLPLFFFFFLHLAGVMEMLRLHGKLEAALWNTGNQMALYTHTLQEMAVDIPDVGGLNYLRLECMDEEECVDIVVTYQVKPPVTIFPFGYRRMGNRYYARCWTGYDVTQEDQGHRYVYVTPYGEVWHSTPECSYIYHEVKSVSVDQIEKGTYELCEFCEEEPEGERVYVTREGKKYHRKSNCSAIYKDIMAIEWYEELPYRACSRCAIEG